MLAELSGDVDHGCGTGAALQQVPVPAGLAGRPYGEVVVHLALSQRLMCLGLYRRKSENPGALGTGGFAQPAFHAHACAPACPHGRSPGSQPPPPAAAARAPLAAGTRLSYVVCNPKWEELLEPTDGIFVLRPREAG